MEPTITKHLTDGGIPSAWTPQNLDWLAKTHRRFTKFPPQHDPAARAAWHARWATLIEDVLESLHGPR